jgi:hypothetical protein
MQETFGHSAPMPAQLEQSMRIVIHAEQLELKWSHCSASADFLSQYYAGVLATGRNASQLRDLSHGISYLANELIENAVKFRSEGDVEFVAGMDGGEFVLCIRHCIAPETSGRFKKLLKELTAGDPGDLLIQRIEANALGTGSGSGLGILTLMNDYGARLTWRFASADQSSTHLETVARLPIGESATTPSLSKTNHGNQE